MSGVTIARGSGRRPLDSEVNMLPLIDLLMCMVSFLLITAVWSTMSRLEADDQGAHGSEAQADEPTMHVTMRAKGPFVVEWKHGSALVSRVEAMREPVRDDQPRFDALSALVAREWRVSGAHHNADDPHADRVVVHCDNDVPYRDVAAVFDAIDATARVFPGARTRLPVMTASLAAGAD